MEILIYNLIFWTIYYYICKLPEISMAKVLELND